MVGPCFCVFRYLVRLVCEKNKKSGTASKYRHKRSGYTVIPKCLLLALGEDPLRNGCVCIMYEITVGVPLVFGT